MKEYFAFVAFAAEHCSHIIHWLAPLPIDYQTKFNKNGVIFCINLPSFFFLFATFGPVTKSFSAIDNEFNWANRLNALVFIVEYNQQWQTLYELEAKLIREVTGNKILAIEHFGSTAVPNLGAKNIVDIMAGINGLEEAKQLLNPLKSIGYTKAIPQEDNTEWYFCLEKSQETIGYHLHLVRFGSEHWKKQLVFRDFLRKSPETAQEYYTLKKE